MTRRSLLLFYALLLAPVACNGQAAFNNGNTLLPKGGVLSSDANSVRTLTTTLFAGHLYVVGATSIERFPIENGVPHANPDLKYLGSYSHIALDSLHYLYASKGMKVYVFAPNSTAVARTLTVTTGHRTFRGIESMVLDSQRRLYVTFTTYFDGCSTACFETWNMVYVYAAGASGNASTLQAIAVEDNLHNGSSNTYTPGLAIDAQGEILVSSVMAWTRDVFSYASLTASRRTAVAGGNPFGLAVDTSNELFVDNPNGAISVYVRSSAGTWSLSRTVTVIGVSSFGTGIVTAGNRLFLENPTAGAVYEVNSLVAGPQHSIATVNVAGAQDVRVGP